jgi:hypothetical protein
MTKMNNLSSDYKEPSIACNLPLAMKRDILSDFVPVCPLQLEDLYQGIQDAILYPTRYSASQNN